MMRSVSSLLLSLALVPIAFAQQAKSSIAAADFARTQVAERLSREGYAADVQVLSSGKRGPSSDDTPSFSLRPIGGRWPRDRVPAVVDYWNAARNQRDSTTVWLSVNIPADVPVYARHHAPGEQLTDEAFATASLNLAALAHPSINTSFDLTKVRLRQSVREGQPALESHFEPLPDVQKNDRVTLTVESGAVRIQTPAKALQEGQTGDTVSVRIDAAQQTVQARVTAKGEVSLVH